MKQTIVEKKKEVVNGCYYDDKEEKCEYCGKKEKNIQELYDKKCYSEIFYNFFRVNLQIYGSSVQRVFRINYCPMCGRKLV